MDKKRAVAFVLMIAILVCLYAWKTKNQPMLVLNPNATNFFEMTIDDFTMENYEPMKP